MSVVLRLIVCAGAVLLCTLVSSRPARAQYYVPNFVYRVPYQAPTVYNYAPRAVYYPSYGIYGWGYRGYDPYFYPPGRVVINVYGRRRPIRVPTPTTIPARPITGHPSHYFGDPHASQTLTPALTPDQ